MSMFALESQLIQEVEEDNETPLTGKKARTGVTPNRNLPPVRVNGSDKVGDILERYILDLMEKEHGDAATALGNVYNTLVRFNWARVPAGSMLAKTSETSETTEQSAHCVRI